MNKKEVIYIQRKFCEKFIIENNFMLNLLDEVHYFGSNSEIVKIVPFELCISGTNNRGTVNKYAWLGMVEYIRKRELISWFDKFVSSVHEIYSWFHEFYLPFQKLII